MEDFECITESIAQKIESTSKNLITSTRAMICLAVVVLAVWNVFLFSAL
jgi:hypothetical protein